MYADVICADISVVTQIGTCLIFRILFLQYDTYEQTLLVRQRQYSQHVIYTLIIAD